MDNKLLIFLFSLLILLSSCSDRDPMEYSSDEESDPYTDVSFSRSGDADDVSILVFRKTGSGDLLWTQTLNPVWTRKGSTDTYEAGARIETGDYQFLFYKHTPDKVIALPDDLSGKKITDILFEAEANGAGYVKSVDEIFMPAPDNAVQIYRFAGGKNESRTVPSTLYRAVSKVEIHLMRGHKVYEGHWSKRPYVDTATDNILKVFNEDFSYEITNIGTSLDVSGGVGSVAMKGTGKFVLDSEGFASYESPFVFPNGSNAPSGVNLVLTRPDNSTETVSVSGYLPRNKKLVVWVWLSYTDISFTVTLEQMTAEDGDDGTWGGGVS